LIRYTDRFAEAGIEASVWSIGESHDNALAETINGLYKAEVIRPNGPWRNIEEVDATREWVDWFNNRPAGADRQHSAGRVRSDVRSGPSESDHGGWTQLTESPENPGRSSWGAEPPRLPSEFWLLTLLDDA
jgi:transposase InsO family protein